MVASTMGAPDLSEAQHKPLFQASNKRTEKKPIETPAPSTVVQSAAPTTPSDTAQTPLKLTLAHDGRQSRLGRHSQAPVDWANASDHAVFRKAGVSNRTELALRVAAAV